MTSSRQSPKSSEQDPLADDADVRADQDNAASKLMPSHRTSGTEETKTSGHEAKLGESLDGDRGNSRDIPLEFGRYRIERKLGQGGMGAVFLARDQQLDRRVALKIPFFREDDTAAVERFHREARAMATLQHANLCPIFDVGQFQRWHFLTMAYIDGQSLSEKLRVDGVLSVSHAVTLILTVAHAVQRAHEAGIVHRDLKPSNIMLTSQLEPIIMDFGLARRESSVEVELTQSQAVLGTPGYMAPEQVEANHDQVGPATDVYALGIILYQMITGQRPFRGSLASVYGQIVSREPDPPSTLCPNLPNAIDRICLKAIAKSPAQRHASAAEFARELSQYLSDSSDLLPTVGFEIAPNLRIKKAPVNDEASASQLRRDAELRQVTVAVFTYETDEFSLSDASTSQSEQLHDQAQTFATFINEQVTQLGGVTVHSSGEEVIACFGFPQAFEDATQRAVRAALQVMGELSPANTSTLPTHEQICVTIHSGEAVAEATGGALGTEYSLVGEARNAAMRLSALTEPGSIVISAATHRRVSLFFHCQSLGLQRVRGMGQPVELFQVVKEAASRNRVELVDPGNLTPLTGRDTELTILKDRWEQALDELGQIVLLIGDAGLGKSRLIRELREHVITEDSEDAAIIELRCSQYHQNASLFPLVEFLSQLLQLEHRSAEERLDAIVQYLDELQLGSPSEVSLFCNMLDVSTVDRYPALELPPQRLKELTQELLLEWLNRLVKTRPVLFIVEDLHWVDPSTIALIERHVATFKNGRTLTLLTFRPEFETAWKSKQHQTQIALSRLTKRQIGQMVERRTRRSEIPDSILQHVIDRTEGIPLFIEEFANVIVESGILDRADVDEDSVSLSSIIPATLHDLLLSRLERMEADREVIQLAATIGREFTFELLAAACPLSSADLQSELDKLVHAEILFQKGSEADASYIFKHALLQDAAYAAMLSKKRQACHQRIAEVLHEQFRDVVEAQPALLAQHYSEAGQTEKAVHYWLRAGQHAQRLSANTEAISLLTRGLELLQTLDESPQRDQLELSLQTTLGPVLMATRGWSAPEVGTSIERARLLCSRIGTVADQFFVMWGLWGWRVIRADMDICDGVAEDIMRLVEASPDDQDLLLEAYWVLGCTAYYKGQFKIALEYFENGLALFDDKRARANSLRTGQNCGVMYRSHIALAKWELGFPTQALLCAEESVQLAKDLNHPFSIAMAIHFRRRLLQCCGRTEQARESVEEEYELCREQGFIFFEVHAVLARGEFLVRTGQLTEAHELCKLGLQMLHATGGKLSMDHPFGRIADAYVLADRADDAKEWISRGIALVEDHNYRSMESEFLRLKGERALSDGDPTNAESYFQRAAQVAHCQGSRSRELRAIISLTRLRKTQDRLQEGQEMLRQVYSSFVEGLDTLDLLEAKSLLNNE